MNNLYRLFIKYELSLETANHQSLTYQNPATSKISNLPPSNTQDRMHNSSHACTVRSLLGLGGGFLFEMSKVVLGRMLEGKNPHQPKSSFFS